MNTMVNTPTRRPSSLFDYEKILKDRNTRVSEENAAREKAEQTTAQKFINNLCESIQRSYITMQMPMLR